MDYEKQIEEAKKPGATSCPVCGDMLYSPMDKLSILLYGKCPIHLEDGSHEENNLLKLAEAL